MWFRNLVSSLSIGDKLISRNQYEEMLIHNLRIVLAHRLSCKITECPLCQKAYKYVTV